ncbi:MAG: AraC family transcriptional regulator [Pseudomonadota bacterium]
MSESPNIYLDDPDPLSLLLDRLALTAEVYVNGDFCGTWAVDTAGSRRIPFHLIGSGEAWLHFDSAEPHKLTERDLVLFPRDAHHVISSSADKVRDDLVNAPMSNDGATTQMVCGFFEFRNPLAYPLLDALPDAVVLRASGKKQVRHLALLVDLMLLELKQAKPGSYAVVDQLAYLMFIEILREQVASGVMSQGLLVALFDTRIGRALNAIHQQPDRDWSLDTLAECAAMSRSSFADHFSRVAGLTPVKYLTLWRMAEARRLLATTKLSTADIAERSGYETEAAFRKAFKKTQGKTPGEVRKAAKGQV